MFTPFSGWKKSWLFLDDWKEETRLIQNITDEYSRRSLSRPTQEGLQITGK